ncbi:MAG TPA: ABC transporter permease [Longimicrobium sp.]|jgi:putative ABC transport system permease protein
MHSKALLALLRGRYRALFRRGEVEARLSEEIQFHLEMETEKNIRAGMSPDEARRAARLVFGGVDRISEDHRDARGTRLVEDALIDVRYAARSLARTPGFVAVCVVTLGIAIGVGTSLFSAVDGFFYRPLPVPGGRDLVAVYTSDYGGELLGGSSHADLLNFAAGTSGIAELAGESGVAAAVGSGDDTAMRRGALVSSGYFAALRVKPALGRFPAGARADEPAIVLGYTVWQRAFGADPSVVGKTVSVNGHFYRVAAVAPREFLGITREFANEFWVDAAFAPMLLPGEPVLDQRGNRRFQIVGRLREGASMAELRARLATVAARLYQDDPASWREEAGHGRRVTVMLERESRVAGIAPGQLLMMVGGVTALGLGFLLVASANLASLYMARALARRREIATRLALGAGRGRLIRQLLTEGAVVAVPGALLGIALAYATSVAVGRYRPDGFPNVDLSLDGRALLFTAGGTLVALLVFGLVPAIQSARTDVLSYLKDGGYAGSLGIQTGRVRGGLVVTQVALSLMFTAGSVLIASAFRRLAEDRRVDASGVLVAPATLLQAAGDSVRASALVRDVIAQLDGIPGIEAASAAMMVPLSGSRSTTSVVPRDTREAGGSRSVDMNLVRPRFFEVVGLPLVRGRDFSEGEMGGSARVAIVSTALAERLWPGSDPIGKRLQVDAAGADVEVVGLVGEMGKESPGEGLLYLPLQAGGGSLVLHLRAGGSASALAAPVARELRRYNAQMVAPEVTTMSSYMDRAFLPQRIAARASGVLALLQMVLAVAGLSGLVAFVTAQRSREIGIRAALGAGRSSIVGLVLRQGIRLTAIGGVAGVALSLLMGRVIATSLPVGAVIELRALAAAIACFALVAGAAMLLPARRALAVTPAAALRAD